ncbi:MAG TPA: ubiquinol-cytochrome c reductase iron-sulfur subunit [Blastocatellia bacterium]|nr:ubiquinol-cytochrome c reductase iron-sulfur subunit [Blastocatellia bacterium]
MSQTLDRDSQTSEETWTPVSEGRRSFLGLAIGALGSVIAAAFAVTLGRYIVGPSFKTEDDSGWTQVGLAEDLPDGKWVKCNVTVSQNAGWGRFNTQRPVWVLKNGGSLTVFTATCPHLGCTVNMTGGGGFVCPCHGSAWNSKGVKLGGPAPRGLDTLESRIDGDNVLVKYEYFKQGVLEKRPSS